MEKKKPLLVYNTTRVGFQQKQILCSISDPTKTYSTSINPIQLRATRLCTVQHGWYLLQNYIANVSEFFLWHPYHLKKITLPSLNHNGNNIAYYILSPPLTQNPNDQPCSIFLFPKRTLSILYCHLGDKQWTQANFEKGVINGLDIIARRSRRPPCRYSSYFINPIYCNGCLYASVWAIPEFRLAQILIQQPKGLLKMKSRLFLMPKLLFRPTYQNRIERMLESNHQIFWIEILQAHDRVIAVSFYRFDPSQTMWEKVKSLKDRMFCISSLDSYSFACQPSNPETEGGRIYIALDDKDFVYIYNIEDDSLMISQSFSNLPKYRSYSRWIMPNIGSSDTLKDENGEAQQVREIENMCGAIHLKDTEEKFALPIDIVEIIGKHIVDVFDYLQFRAINRLFHLAAPPLERKSSSSSMSMSRFDDLSLSPLFMFSENKDNMFSFVHPKHGLKYKYNINFPEFWNLRTDWKICCSKDGWLILHAGTSRLSFFFNPFTKQVLSPELRFPIWNTRCVGLSHPPTSSECVVVDLDKRVLPSHIVLHTYMPSEHGWDKVWFDKIEFPLYNISPALHNGLFYYLSTEGKLAVIEAPRGEIAKWKEFVEPQAPCTGFFNSFLVECKGSLLSVFECCFRKWVQVFKLNESTMTWIKVESLNNHMLFVGNNTSLSAVAKIPGMENKIYFPRFYDESIVFYCLETNKYHTFENEVVNFHHVKEHLNGCWIDPRWHSDSDVFWQD